MIKQQSVGGASAARPRKRPLPNPEMLLLASHSLGYSRSLDDQVDTVHVGERQGKGSVTFVVRWTYVCRSRFPESLDGGSPAWPGAASSTHRE
jgi:hypothetical protein